ncbi:MAG: hypothetical protein IKP88_15565 [Lachnospiraceae bacterium]|nr:hypothetical protein [Lachnospiraceae bacterium]
MDTKTKQIRENERLSHTEIYTKEKLYDTDTWLKKPINTIQEIVPMFTGYFASTFNPQLSFLKYTVILILYI